MTLRLFRLLPVVSASLILHGEAWVVASSACLYNCIVRHGLLPERHMSV